MTAIGNLDKLAQQYEDAIERMLQASNKMLVQFQNSLFKDEFDINRFFIAEEIGPALANSSITLTPKLTQPILIEGLIVNIDANLAATLTIDRYSRIVTNTQSRENIIAPVKYIVGPGKILRISWTSAPTQMPYFAAYGKYIGSVYG